MIPLAAQGIQRRSIPFATGALLAASVFVFLYQLTLNDLDSFLFTYRYGAVPAELFGKADFGTTYLVLGQRVVPIDVSAPIPVWATILTSMFMHVGFLHLGTNLLFLWTFGRSIEDRYGHIAFVALYLASGIVAAVAQSLVDRLSVTPMIGASGAVAGILGAFILLYPLSRINTLLFVGLIFTVRIPAIFLLGFWAALQYFNGVASLGPDVSGGGVAYFAHLGGFGFGIAVTLAVAGGDVGRRLVAGVRRIRERRSFSHATGRATEPPIRSGTSCPFCGNNSLDYSDDTHQWHCRRCGSRFS